MLRPTFKILTKLLNLAMLFLMAFAAGVLLALPSITRWYIHLDVTFHILDGDKMYYYILIILYIAGVCAIIVLNELRKIFKTCSLENPFIIENVRSLRLISTMSLIITVLFFTKVWVINSFFTMIVVFIFLLATLFCYVLAELFENAVHYKAENELTI